MSSSQKEMFEKAQQPRGYSAIAGSFLKNAVISIASFAIAIKSAETAKELMAKEERGTVDYLKSGACVVGYMAGVFNGVSATFDTTFDAVDFAKRSRQLDTHELYKKWKADKDETKTA